MGLIVGQILGLKGSLLSGVEIVAFRENFFRAEFFVFFETHICTPLNGFVFSNSYQYCPLMIFYRTLRDENFLGLVISSTVIFRVGDYERSEYGIYAIKARVYELEQVD